jgi:hypothetical protein
MLDDEYTVESIPQSIYTDEEHNKNEQSYTGTGLTVMQLQEGGERETHRKASLYIIESTQSVCKFKLRESLRAASHPSSSKLYLRDFHTFRSMQLINSRMLYTPCHKHFAFLNFTNNLFSME